MDGQDSCEGFVGFVKSNLVSSFFIWSNWFFVSLEQLCMFLVFGSISPCKFSLVPGKDSYGISMHV